MSIRIVVKCFINLLLKLGSAFIFFIQSLHHCFTPPYYLSNIARQIIEIGFLSLPILGLTGIFIGVVIVLQSSLSGVH
ncbi:MAG: hypothetical protein ACR5KW_04480 [Wolbachia sp.]